jgi:hypothetical protein
MRLWIRWNAILGLVLMMALTGAPVTRAQGGSLYLPLVTRNFNPLAAQRTLNAPPTTDWSRMAIAWFGAVSPAENYADVRVGFDNSELVVTLMIFDRLLWYDTTPSAADLTQWDSVSLYLNLTGNSGSAPTANAYRFDVQLSDSPCSPCVYQAAYRGNGSGWAAGNYAFTATTSYSYEDLSIGGTNNGQNNRGWFAWLRIPFTSLGLAGRPADGTVWGMALTNHDRENLSGPPLTDKTWPETADGSAPSSWGRLRFGLPGWTPPAVSNLQTINIRHGLNGAVVPDANVGGIITNLCAFNNGTASAFVWNQWANVNDHTDTGANVQNQGNLADWPCFAKYYVTFPLNQLPPGRIIRTATLRLHHTANTGAVNQAQASWVQVLTVGSDWNQTTLTWNNAPLAMENVAQTLVPVLPGCDYTNPQPCAWRTWDVSRAVANAYAAGQTALRLAVYSSDLELHSGKIFGTSDQNDYYAVSRPTLEVQLGTP